MFQLPTTIYIKQNPKTENKSLDYMFEKYQSKLIFITRCLNSITISEKNSIEQIHLTIKNEIKNYKTALQDFLITLPQSNYPSTTYEELLEAINNHQEQNNITLQQINYNRNIKYKLIQNLDTHITQIFYPTTTPFKKHINQHYPK